MMKNYGIGSFNSFLLSFCIYLFLIFFMFYELGNFKSAFRYTDLQNTSFVDIEFNENDNIIIDEKNIGKKTTLKNIKTQEIEQKQSSINDLFGNIDEFLDKKTKTIQDISKSDKKTNNIKNTKQSQKILNLEKKQNKDQTLDSIDLIYNDFLGRVHRVLENRWRLYESSGNFEVEVGFYIDKDGKFGYDYVTKSLNQNFDLKVLEFLKNLNGKFVAFTPDLDFYSGTLRLSDKIKIGDN